MAKRDVVMVGIVGTVEMEMVADVTKQGAPRLPRVADPNLRSRQHQFFISENRLVWLYQGRQTQRESVTVEGEGKGERRREAHAHAYAQCAQ